MLSWWIPRLNAMPQLKYRTRNNIEVIRTVSKVPFRKGLKDLLHSLDEQRGIYLSSGYEYPGRYSRWDIASVCPPLEIVALGTNVELRPLNERGVVLNQLLLPVLQPHPHWDDLQSVDGRLVGRLKPLPRSVFRGRAEQAAFRVFRVARSRSGVPN